MLSIRDGVKTDSEIIINNRSVTVIFRIIVDGKEIIKKEYENTLWRKYWVVDTKEDKP